MTMSCISEESDSASIDHLSDGEDKVLAVRTKKIDPTPRKKATKMFNENFFTSIFSGLPRDDFDDSNDPKTYEQDKTYEYGTLITSNWIARNYVKKIMINPTIKFRDIIALILKKYKCKVTASQTRKGKIKALQQYVTCLEDHYEMLWSYAAEILSSNEGSTCKLGVDHMNDGKTYFSSFYVCFKALKDRRLQGCGKVVVNVGNKKNRSWFMQCLSDDLRIVDGEGLTIIFDQHKGIIEAAKMIMPLVVRRLQHRQPHLMGRGLSRINGKVIRQRRRGDGSRSMMYPDGIRPIGYGVSWDPIDEEAMLGLHNSMSLPKAAWLARITPEDDEEPVQDEELVEMRTLESFKKELIMFVEDESCPVYDTDNEEEESMPVYDTDIEDVIERKKHLLGKEDLVEKNTT
ncbi:hypothetical protein Tco_0586730 [Tanacetum coccineum]